MAYYFSGIVIHLSAPKGIYATTMPHHTSILYNIFLYLYNYTQQLCHTIHSHQLVRPIVYAIPMPQYIGVSNKVWHTN